MAKSRPEGPPTRSRARRAHRLLVDYNYEHPQPTPCPLLINYISEVLCQKSELIDLSVRTDVETFDWDGDDVDYYTDVK